MGQKVEEAIVRRAYLLRLSTEYEKVAKRLGWNQGLLNHKDMDHLLEMQDELFERLLNASLAILTAAKATFPDYEEFRSQVPPDSILRL